jgi:hypothetical protein
MNIESKIYAFFIILFIYSCATPSTVSYSLDKEAVEKEARIQKEIALKQNIRYNQRLFRVGYPILKNNASLCGSKVYYPLGVSWSNIDDYGDEWEEAATSVLGTDEYLRISFVGDGSPAKKSDIRVGDKLIAINELYVGDTKRTYRKFNKEYQEAISSTDYYEITLERDGAEISKTLYADEVCAYPIVLGETDAVNAYADGKQIIIDKGMLRFVESDKELGLVIAHELGHNAMGHMDKKMTNYALGSIFDIAAAAYGVDTQGMFGSAAAQAYSQAFESEADYVGIYYLYRAGYDIENVSDFWRRMAAEHPGSIRSNHSSTHPATPERFLKIDMAVDEINKKIINNEALIPNLLD